MTFNFGSGGTLQFYKNSSVLVSAILTMNQVCEWSVIAGTQDDRQGDLTFHWAGAEMAES